MSDTPQLPVSEILPELRRALLAGRNLVLVAPPGAGKSTVVPLVLLDEAWAKGKRILLLEPRRLAARAVAGRMAQTLHEAVGRTVGYRMRLDTRVSSVTRLEVVTEGVLTRMLQSDPALEGVAAVIFDEYHERSLHADLGLALCLEAQETIATDLRLLVMSATLDSAAVSSVLGDAPVIEAKGRAYPVTTTYLGNGLPSLPEHRTMMASEVELIARAIRRVLAETQGDVLVFLPGAPEIHRLRGVFEAEKRDGVVIHALYGELDFEAQQQALLPAPPGLRKVILATNVAETSLTIEGVLVVIDTGLARRSLFDPATGMSRLATVRISQASAQQRAGRAGRTAPGSAWRLWGESAQRTLAVQTPPEILNTDLTPLALELALWGARETASLRWMDAPPEATMNQARQLLRGLEAIDGEGAITATGREMSATGLHPRLAHMLVRARRSGQGSFAAQLAALLSERDLLRRARDPDLRSRLELLRGSTRDADPGALARVRDHMRRLGVDARERYEDNDAGLLLAWAFPDRIAQRRPAAEGSNSRRYLLANGRGALLAQVSTLANAEYLVAVELDDAPGAEAHIQLAAPLTRAQLDVALGGLMTDTVETDTDPRSGVLRSRRVRRLESLVLDERRIELDADMAREALLDQLRQKGVAGLPWGDNSRRLRARLLFVIQHAGSALSDWPMSEDAALLGELEQWLAPWLDGLTRLDQLTDNLLAKALLARLTHAQQRQLDQWAPVQLKMPTGTHVTVDYEDDNAPCVEVRMQEVFGLADTPRVASGRVPVTLKLLSPARRPMQITRDLAGFWRGSYADVRKDMRGRYPRHYWPENPLEAEPTRGLKPRRSQPT